MKTKGLCWGCNLPIEGRSHYHEGECRTANKLKQDAQRHAVKRQQSASLNQGQPVGKHNKELANRIEKFTLRSRSEVARMMNLSVEGVRIIEMRAMEKVRKALMPFRGAVSGEAKVKQITQPIPSLSD